MRYTESNIPVATFSLAVNRSYTNQEGEREADFINIVVWRKQAENVKNYLRKGDRAGIEGRIQTRNYDDQDGNKKYITEVVAESVEFLETKKESATSTEKTTAPVEETNPYEEFGNSIETESDFGEQIEISDEELPF